MSEICVVAGGTKGLGQALAKEALHHGVRPIVIGRSAVPNSQDEIWKGMDQIKMDLSRPRASVVARLAHECTNKLFWVAGIFLRKNFTEVTSPEFWDMVCTHLWGPFYFMQEFHKARVDAGRPYQLIMIASTSSWMLRKDEDLYGAVKAAKAQLVRNLSSRISLDLPGSKVTLINPGGMKTENFWSNTGQDISKFMDPAGVAKGIWQRLDHAEVLSEWQVKRLPDGQAEFIAGAMKPSAGFLVPVP